MADTHADKLAEAIEESGFVTVVRKSEATGSVRLLCRVSNKRAWCAALEYVLVRKKDWTEHICQQYFIRNGKLVYGWNFILNADDISSAVNNACSLLTMSWRVASQTQTTSVGGAVDTMPLVGASPRRTAKTVFDPRQPGPSRGGPSHKGAYTVGSGG